MNSKTGWQISQISRGKKWQEIKRINLYALQMVKEKGVLYDLDSKKIGSPKDAAAIIEEVLQLSKKPSEHFRILCLDAKKQVAGIHLLFKGTSDLNITHPRKIFQAALLNNAHTIICFHNHPSGNCEPSEQDLQTTERLKTCGEILGIELIDHIIIGDGTYISLKKENYM